MITRSQSGIVKPIDRLSLNTFLISPIPKNPFDTLKDPQWRNAMYDEYNALIKNGTWLLIPRPAGVKMVLSMWLFKHKFHADRTLNRYKARLVANGSSQQLVANSTIDVKDCFSLMVIIIQRLSHTSTTRFCDAGGSQVVYLSFILDDIILTASYTTLLQQLIDSSTRLFLSQRKYALQLLERAHMVNCNPSRTPMDTESKLGSDGVPVQDPTMYRSLGTLDLGLHLHASSTTSLVGYTDADWAGCPSTRGTEAEYRGVANVVAETAWLHNLLHELHSPLSTATLVYCDNISAVYMSANPVQHQRTKHIEIDIHFVRDIVTAGQIRVLHVPSRYQYVDIFTKGLPSALFEEFRSCLSVRPPPAPTAGAY
ncbi:ribonuclease H-like domain-containing protein [Tanacetum coccineum]